MQHKAIKLMASKLAAAGMIEGTFTDEGLAAMSECQDMTTLMAKELMLGIKDSVEDVSAAFKRMAVLHPRAEIVTLPVFTEAPVAIERRAPGTRPEPHFELVEFTMPVPAAAPTPTPEIWNPFEAVNVLPTRKKHGSGVDLDQITLFELAGKPA